MHLGIERILPDILYASGWLAALLSIIWNPRVGVYYVIPLLPLQTVRYRMHAYPLGQSMIDIVLLVVIVGVYLRRTGPELFLRTKMDKVLVTFIIFYYLWLWRGAFYLGGPFPLYISDPRFSDWKNYVELPVIFWVVSTVIRTPKQMKILLVLMALSVLMVNRSFHSTMGDRNVSHFSYGVRYAGALGYAGENGLGAFEAEFTLFLIGLYSYQKRWLYKLPMLLVIGTSIYCLIFTFSRGAYLAMVVGLLFLGFVKKRSLLLIAIGVVLAWQVVLPKAVQERLTMTYSADGQLESSAEERVDLWEDAMAVIRANPLIGTGYETYEFMARVGPYRDTHNLYLKVMLETGIFGLVLILVLMGKAFRAGWELSRCTQDPFLASIGLGFAALMLSAMVANFFGDRWTYQQVSGYLWAAMGLVARGHALRQDGDATSSADAEPSAVPLEEEIPSAR